MKGLVKGVLLAVNDNDNRYALYVTLFKRKEEAMFDASYMGNWSEAARPKVVRALSSAVIGENLVITRLEGDQKFRGKMISLGLMPGVALSIDGGGSGQPFLVDIQGGKLALDAKSAGRIMVAGFDSKETGGVL